MLPEKGEKSVDSGQTGAPIAEARKAMGLTQRQLAETLHISDRTVSKWERGAGFPDVALLEPLADALGLTVRSLLRGEAEPPEAESAGTVSAAPEDVLLREVIRTLYQQQRGKLRRNIGRVFGGLAALALVGFVLFGILDRSGAFQREIARTVTAGIYQDAERVGETTVTIEGSLYWLGERSFWGTLAVEPAAKTCREGTYGSVSWGREETEGYQEIYWGRAGVTRVETEVQPDCYVSPDLQRFALTLSDGRVVATDETLAALQALTPCRYVLDWQVEYPSMRCYRK